MVDEITKEKLADIADKKRDIKFDLKVLKQNLEDLELDLKKLEEMENHL